MDDVLSLNLPCVTCGYELRGLQKGGMCPECGTAIQRSLSGDLLSAADPAWLRTIARGQRFIARGFMVALISMLTVIVLVSAFVFTTLFAPGLPRQFEDAITAVITLVSLGIPLALCGVAIGIFFLTKQEGRLTDRESIWSARNLARWSAPLSVAALFVVLAVRSATLPGGPMIVIDIAMRLTLLVMITTSALSLLAHLESLLRRIPDDALVEEITKERRFLRWAVPAAGLYLLMGPILLAGGMAGPGGAVVGMFGGVIGCVGFIALLGLIVSVVRLAGLMRRCANRLQSCQLIAEEADSR